MRNNSKNIITILLVIIVATSGVVFFMWNKPQRNVEDEKGIVVTAAQLVQEYQASEPEANKKYLDKAIQVSGIVGDVKTNQDGNATITLASDDAFSGVFCTLKTKEPGVTTGATVTIKGICSGMLSDVRLREAVVVK